MKKVIIYVYEGETLQHCTEGRYSLRNYVKNHHKTDKELCDAPNVQIFETSTGVVEYQLAVLCKTSNVSNINYILSSRNLKGFDEIVLAANVESRDLCSMLEGYRSLAKIESSIIRAD